MTAARPRLLAIGDAFVPTGFARVTSSVLARLADRYEIHQLGVNYRGQEHQLPWPVTATSEEDDIGAGQLPALVKAFQPDVVWSVGDLWMQCRWMEALESFPSPPRTILYMPVDSGPVDPEQLARIAGADRLVMYTEFARRELEAALARLPDGPRPQIGVVPHGLDAERFFPLAGGLSPRASSPARRLAQERLFGGELGDAFIVLNANRNIPRKRVDLTVAGFALFAAGKPPSVRLHLHMGIEDLGWNVVRLARRFGVEERLILTSQARDLPAIPDAQLNLVYNAAAVGVNTSVAEAWGLVAFEHAGTGAPQVVPRHSGCGELWETSGVTVEPALTLTARDAWTDEHHVSPEGLAEGLERLYADSAFYEETAAACYRNATRPEYSWTAVGRRWDALLQEVLDEERPGRTKRAAVTAG